MRRELQRTQEAWHHAVNERDARHTRASALLAQLKEEVARNETFKARIRELEVGVYTLCPATAIVQCPVIIAAGCVRLNFQQHKMSSVCCVKWMCTLLPCVASFNHSVRRDQVKAAPCRPLGFRCDRLKARPPDPLPLLPSGLACGGCLDEVPRKRKRQPPRRCLLPHLSCIALGTQRRRISPGSSEPLMPQVGCCAIKGPGLGRFIMMDVGKVSHFPGALA